jgi:hypothetical protein
MEMTYPKLLSQADTPPMDRRDFSRWTLGLSGAALLPRALRSQPPRATPNGDVPASIRALKPMTAGVVPISIDERKARIA